MMASRIFGVGVCALLGITLSQSSPGRQEATENERIAEEVAAPVAHTNEVAPDWFNRRLEELTRDGGRWEADNSNYRSDTEPFPSYGLEFTMGISGRTARARLYGIHDDDREQDFWEFYIYWDPLNGKAITMQTHVGGAFGYGDLQQAEPGVEELKQTFWWGEGSTTRTRHREHVTDDGRHSQSFSYQDGQWVPQREYVWRRVGESQNP